MTDTDTAQSALAVSALNKSFGAVPVLKDISVDMEPGDFLVLVGPSGCGKSTLLNCVAGLETVTSGTIRINGQDVTQSPPRDRDIAMVFQSYALYPTMSVAENIAFGMKVRRVPKPEQDAKTLEVAQLLQIDHLLDRKPSQLSGGQRQRVAIGRALVREPILFLFDEPLSNLDAKLRVEMRGEIKRLHERLNASIVYVTHDQIEAMTLGTRIVVLKDGVIQQTGTPTEIYESPANLFVADFMGSPPMNLVHTHCRMDDGKAVLSFADGAGGVSIADHEPPAGLAAYDGREVIFGIRPEAFTAIGEADASVKIVADLIENAGSDTFVTFPLGQDNAIARLPGRMEVAAGNSLNLSADMSMACYFDPDTTNRIVG